MTAFSQEREANRARIVEADKIARRLTQQIAAYERELTETKWFDYRFISPYAATERFVQDYGDAFRRKWSLNFSTEEAQRKLGTLRNGWTSRPAEFTSFWSARQFVDGLGLPYAFFLENAIEFLLRRGWRRIPRPNQLYSGMRADLLIAHVQKIWDEHCQNLEITVSDLPVYKNENFRNLPAQNSHRAWSMKQLGLYYGDPRKIALLCFEKRVLTQEEVAAVYGQERVDRAVEECAVLGIKCSETPRALELKARPSCFGILHARTDDADQCRSCCASKPCSAIITAIERHLVNATGSSDPIAQRRRKQQAERTARHRAAKRAALPLRSPGEAKSEKLKCVKRKAP